MAEDAPLFDEADSFAGGGAEIMTPDVARSAGSCSQHRSVVFPWNRAGLPGPAPSITSELDVGGTHMLLAIWLNLIFIALAIIFVVAWLVTGRKNRTLLLICLAFFMIGTMIGLTRSLLE
jgi:hypothetical protein